MPESWTISEAAQRVGLDPDTVRYYERRGVLPTPQRDSSGRRVYSASDVHLIEVLLHLRGNGMPLAAIAEFTRWVASDPGGVAERLELLRQHRDHVQDRITDWKASLEVIDGKIEDYTRRLADGE